MANLGKNFNTVLLLFCLARKILKTRGAIIQATHKVSRPF